MIEQLAYYVGKTPVEQEEIKQVLDYPGIEVINHIVKQRYMIIFKHEKVLTKKDFNLESAWIIGANHKYELCTDENGMKAVIKED